MLRDLKEFKLPEIEEKVLKFWKENRIFEKAVALRQASASAKAMADRQGKKFRFFEGPPTANGRPGIHHVLSRAFKDIILRYKTMRGFFVRRQAGWDTHGLPVEIEVEKELGLKNKQAIEKFGIAEFNEKAKMSVWKYKEEWERLTDRIGFWLDLKNPYITYSNDYIESLWWVFSEIAKRRLLKKSFKIVPYCPRCQTPLSSHEMGMPGVYQKVKDPSIFVKFELKAKNSKLKAKEYLLVWTTTPWTLPSNVAVAVNPKLTYTKYKIGNEYLWSFNAPPAEGIEVIEKISGKKLIGLRYEPLFKVKGPWLKNKKFFRVYGADFVSTEEGTGLVHIAPAFGEDDMDLIIKVQGSRLNELDVPITIDERGFVQKGLPGGGKFVKLADKEIIAELEKSKALLKGGVIEHDYPFCWRCNAPVLYFARFSWFIEMSRLRDQLLKNNTQINWVPEHIKEGRFGEWLREIKDWAISRDRYWGTPLPIWECAKCGRREFVGGLEDLNKFRYTKNKFWTLRHGEADHNLKDIIASGLEKGKAVSNLTALGREQVQKAIVKLKKELGKSKLDLIVTSPYLRTKTVAKMVAKATNAKIIIDKRLQELNTGIFNHRHVAEYHAYFANRLERFIKTPPGGENLADVKKRIFSAVLDINQKYQNKNILIVSHGDPLWMLEGAAKNLSNEEILQLPDPKPGELRRLEINNWPYNHLTLELDLHRPYIDQIYLKCRKCKFKMRRVKEVADVWFDSGAMPFAQFHYPFACAQARINADKQSARISADNLRLPALQNCIDFPADYISEGIDQTRGWFYTLLAVATALGIKTPPYLNVITLGLVLDKNGQKMSKSKGNVVSPWDMIQKYGSDVVRWYFYTVNPPAEPKKFNEADLGKTLRKIFTIIYNSFVFLNTYGVKARINADKNSARISADNLRLSADVLDKWILARLNKTIKIITEKLEKYDVGFAGQEIENFVDNLSRWYIRRSRRRFQKPDNQEDLEMASSVLRHCLLELSKLMSPFAPFFAEALYRSLHVTSSMLQVSVHLEDWPKADEKMIDADLLEKMEEIRRLASLALALRAEKGVKVRQPLQALEVRSKKLDVRDKELLEILKDEVNVKEVGFNFQMKEEISLDLNITPELREEGLVRELVRLVQGLRQDANLIPKDKIVLMIDAGGEFNAIFSKNAELIKKEVNAGFFETKKSDKFSAELNSRLDDQPIWIGIRKV